MTHVRHGQPVPPQPEAPPLDGFLVLAADQVGAALDEAAASFGQLTADVLALARHAADAGAPVEAQEATQDALVRLQAIDRLEQRIRNVDRNLRALAFLLRETGQQPSRRDWIAFMAAVRGRYTTEAERAEFDGVEQSGAPR